jgi:TfoX/Sxy family transcriptional regulator of competence genes
VSSEESFVQFVAGQMGGAGEITYRKMFGEYGVYCDGKVVVLVCDDQVFVKQTDGGRSFIGDVVEAPPYPGAKPSFLIEDGLENREWFSELVRISAKELPMPKPRKKKSR